MPGKLFLFTLGFHENFAIRRLLSQAAGEGDSVIAVTVKPAAAAVKTAFGTIENLCMRLKIGEAKLLEVSPENLEESIAAIVEKVHETMAERGHSEVVVDASGGSRILALATLLSALILSRAYKVKYYIQSDTGGDWDVKVTQTQLRLLTRQLTKEKLAILKAITENPGQRPEEIAAKIGMHPKTLKNHLTELKQLGLATQKGRAAGIYPTPWTRIALLTEKIGNPTQTQDK